MIKPSIVVRVIRMTGGSAFAARARRLGDAASGAAESGGRIGVADCDAFSAANPLGTA
jgi:hypothetical protein